METVKLECPACDSCLPDMREFLAHVAVRHGWWRFCRHPCPICGWESSDVSYTKSIADETEHLSSHTMSDIAKSIALCVLGGGGG